MTERRSRTDDLLSGELLDEALELSLSELCGICGVREDLVVELVEEGVVEPFGEARSGWRFSGLAVMRVQRVMRLQRELDVNLAGAALAVDLLEEIERLRRRLAE